MPIVVSPYISNRAGSEHFDCSHHGHRPAGLPRDTRPRLRHWLPIDSTPLHVSVTDTTSTSPTDPTAADLGYAQLHEECLAYNQAIGSFNQHLDNHRDRMKLHDIPFRDPVCTPETTGEMRALLAELLDRAHLDSQVRRHPRTAPIHAEAVEQLEIARSQLRSTLETELERSYR